jgi:hypothetical protein
MSARTDKEGAAHAGRNASRIPSQTKNSTLREEFASTKSIPQSSGTPRDARVSA